MNKQKVLALISHLSHSTPYNYGDVNTALIEALNELIEEKPSQAFQRYYLHSGDDFLQTALSEDSALTMAHEYLKVFPKYESIRISTLDGYGIFVERED
jgi:hypothetical protein